MAKKMSNLGMIVLAIYLIFIGLTQLISLNFSGMHIVLGLLAIAAGVLLLLGK